MGAPHTIFREVDSRLRRGVGKYQTYGAHERALAKRAERGKRLRLKNEVVRAYTTEKMKLGLSICRTRDLANNLSGLTPYEVFYQETGVALKC